MKSGENFAQRAASKTFSAAPITEGVPSFSGLLPPVLLPDAPVFYQYDTDPRILDFFPSISIKNRVKEVALPVENYPTNPGAASFIAEGVRSPISGRAGRALLSGQRRSAHSVVSPQKRRKTHPTWLHICQKQSRS